MSSRCSAGRSTVIVPSGPVTGGKVLASQAARSTPTVATSVSHAWRPSGVERSAPPAPCHNRVTASSSSADGTGSCMLTDTASGTTRTRSFQVAPSVGGATKRVSRRTGSSTPTVLTTAS